MFAAANSCSRASLHTSFHDHFSVNSTLWYLWNICLRTRGSGRWECNEILWLTGVFFVGEWKCYPLLCYQSPCSHSAAFLLSGKRANKQWNRRKNRYSYNLRWISSLLFVTSLEAISRVHSIHFTFLHSENHLMDVCCWNSLIILPASVWESEARENGKHFFSLTSFCKLLHSRITARYLGS